MDFEHNKIESSVINYAFCNDECKNNMQFFREHIKLCHNALIQKEQQLFKYEQKMQELQSRVDSQAEVILHLLKNEISMLE